MDFFTDKHGKIVLLQAPNAPLIVGGIAMLLSWILPYGTANFVAALVAFGALFTWAWLEITEGATLFRRAIGCAVLIWLIVSKLT